MLHRLTVYVEDSVMEAAEGRARDEGILRDNGQGDVVAALTGLLRAYATDRLVVLKRKREPHQPPAPATGVDYVAEHGGTDAQSQG